MYILSLLFQRIRNQHQILHSFIPILKIFGKNIFWVILALLQTFKPNAHETTQKNEKCILQMWLRIHFFIHLWVWTFNFLKKILNRCSLVPKWPWFLSEGAVKACRDLATVQTLCCRPNCWHWPGSSVSVDVVSDDVVLVYVIHFNRRWVI